MRRFGLWLICLCSAAAPTITKIEPPNWWTGQAMSDLRLLIRGTGLKSAQVSTARGFEIIETRPNDSGTYLFVEARVHRAGTFPLKITTPEGSVRGSFEVQAPLPKTGRFRGFSSDDVIYMIMPDRFADGDISNDQNIDRKNPRTYHGGDFQGIIDHLPYLKDLGVTALWLTPLYENGTAYHGYHAIDFYAVEKHFGNAAKLRELVDKAHQNGMKVILDMVMNHTGPTHPWVKDLPLPDWFHGTPERHLNETFQIWTIIDPHAGATLRDPVLDGWFGNNLPDLNQDEPEVSRYLIQNTLWWIASTGIDGIRADTLPYVPRHFWHDWMSAIKKEYPDFKVAGEVFDGDPSVVSFFQGGQARFDDIDSGIDTLFDFPLYGAIRRAFAHGGSLAELAYVTGHDSLYTNPRELITFLGLHDVPRFLSEEGANAASLKLAFTYLMTARGAPMIYYGDEVALRGGRDPENRKDFPGGWKDDIRSAFDPSQRTAEERDIFEYLRTLIHLRQQTPSLRTGRLTQMGGAKNAYVFRRGPLIVLFNSGTQPLKIETDAAPGTWKDLLDKVGNIAVHEHVMTVTLPPSSAAIMMRR